MQVNVPFAFTFYDAPRTAAFVNSDGNVTFDEDDSASTDRNVARLLTGPPRVSLFLSDLDPTAGGRIYVNAAADQYTVTWCAVRGFDSTRVVTAQATLLPSGAIEMKYGDIGTRRGGGRAVARADRRLPPGESERQRPDRRRHAARSASASPSRASSTSSR